MPTQNEIRSDNWVLRLPADWAPVDGPARGHHFASGDGTKGLYIATHVVPPEHAGSLEELAEWFVANDSSTLDEMEGFAWETVARSAHCAFGCCIALLDSFAHGQDARFIGKIMARPGRVVRASFQDHRCHGYAASQAYFAPILASLQLIGLQPLGAGTVYH